MVRLILLVILLTPLALQAVEAADSVRCVELGVNCICNVKMDSTSISAAPDNQHFHINDGATKPCQDEAAGYEISDGSGLQVAGVTSGEDITALPAGHTVTTVLRSNTLNGGFLGHNASSSVPTARRAIRFYKYYSSTYNSQSTSGDSCNANKLAQFGLEFFSGPMFTAEGGTWTIYDINTAYSMNQTVSCCDGPGPGNTDNGPLISAMKGKWWRIEIVTHNASPTGTPISWDVYIKNVTDSGPELHVLDTSQTAAAQGWTSTVVSTLHPTANLDTMLINFFRSTNGLTACAGFASYSHYLYAAWSTDSGQRIGAATEIEGTGTDTTPPSVPSGVRVIQVKRP